MAAPSFYSVEFMPTADTQPISACRPRIGIERLALHRTNDQPKGSMNCQSCRKRKIKCNRLQPSCEACQTFRSECIYDAVPRKRGPKSNPLKARMKKAHKLRLDIPVNTSISAPQPAGVPAANGPDTGTKTDSNAVGGDSIRQTYHCKRDESTTPARSQSFSQAAITTMSESMTPPISAIASQPLEVPYFDFATAPRSAPANLDTALQQTHPFGLYSPASSGSASREFHSDLPLTPRTLPSQARPELMKRSPRLSPEVHQMMLDYSIDPTAESAQVPGDVWIADGSHLVQAQPVHLPNGVSRPRYWHQDVFEKSAPRDAYLGPNGSRHLNADFGVQIQMSSREAACTAATPDHSPDWYQFVDDFAPMVSNVASQHIASTRPAPARRQPVHHLLPEWAWQQQQIQQQQRLDAHRGMIGASWV